MQLSSLIHSICFILFYFVLFYFVFIHFLGIYYSTLVNVPAELPPNPSVATSSLLPPSLLQPCVNYIFFSKSSDGLVVFKTAWEKSPIESRIKQTLPIAIFASEADQTDQRYIWTDSLQLSSVVWQEMFGSFIPKDYLIIDVTPKTGGKCHAALRDHFPYFGLERDPSAHTVIGGSLVNGLSRLYEGNELVKLLAAQSQVSTGETSKKIAEKNSPAFDVPGSENIDVMVVEKASVGSFSHSLDSSDSGSDSDSIDLAQMAKMMKLLKKKRKKDNVKDNKKTKKAKIDDKDKKDKWA